MPCLRMLRRLVFVLFIIVWAPSNRGQDLLNEVSVKAGLVVHLGCGDGQLTANDGEYVDSDRVTINVYNDGCEAARSLPDYEPLVGDLNEDCKVDDVDLAMLQENWLQDNSLTEQ